jgi:hypothetical protein
MAENQIDGWMDRSIVIKISLWIWFWTSLPMREDCRGHEFGHATFRPEKPMLTTAFS